MSLHPKIVEKTGIPLKDAKKVCIMIHGRGATAQSILTLHDHLKLEDFACLAPQAGDNTWYPFSFMEEVSHNQPYLDQALSMLEEVLDDCLTAGFDSSQIYFVGFSQGACLSLEFVARHARPFGGVVAFTGGLIGKKVDNSHYQGNFKDTPIVISGSEQDVHVPFERIHESISQLERMGAKVHSKTFKDNDHLIRPEEIQLANEKVFF